MPSYNQIGFDSLTYLIGLGATAIAFALFIPRGIWGLVEERTGVRFMPVGYRVRRRAPDSGVDP